MSSYPIKWKPVQGEEEREKLFKPQNPLGFSGELNQIEWNGIRVPAKFLKFAERLYNMEVRPDDIWIVTFKKCGTTWTQEIMWHMMNGVDETKSKEEPLEKRSPFLEYAMLNPGMTDETFTMVDNMPRDKPRLIKTHLPFEVLPPKLLDIAKVIFVCRNPKDAMVSGYHHVQLMKMVFGYVGTFDQMAEMFIEGKTTYGGYWLMLKSGWSRRYHPSLKLLWFEDMKRDLVPIIKDLCNFTGYQLTPEKVNELDKIVHIDRVRARGVESAPEDKKEIVRNFFRKGKTGDDTCSSSLRGASYARSEVEVLEDKLIKTERECQDLCDDNPNCIGFVMRRSNSNCYLFEHFQYPTISYPGLDIYYKHCQQFEST